MPPPLTSATPSECYARLAASVLLDAYKVAIGRKAPSDLGWDCPAAAWAFLQGPRARLFFDVLGLDWDAVIEHLERGIMSTISQEEDNQKPYSQGGSYG